MYGYTGLLIRINLTNHKVLVENLNDKLVKNYLGGSGLATYFIYNEVGSTDPFGDENMLTFLTGPLTGTATPFTGRFTVCSCSPLTGILGESNCGGFWGPELKFSGFDGILITGKSEKPVYITIFDGKPEIHNALNLWGRDTYETEDIVKEQHGDSKIKVASIGPAGEKLARIASIICDRGHAAGRCGLGAVMGSKRLKAIAVRGERKVKVANPDALLEVSKQAIDLAKKNAPDLGEYGTAGSIEYLTEIGDMPIKYWKQGVWDGATKISGQTMAKTIKIRKGSCYGCPIACDPVIKISSGPYAIEEAVGPEYETCAAFGSLCLNDSLESVAKANDLCNKYGIDTISAGSLIAFSMECYEKGIITKEDTNGTELTWGNSNAILEMIRKIAYREGFGNILAEGVRRASEKIGKGSEEFAVHIKGMEVPFHDPRAQNFNGLEYATSNIGASHLQSFSFMISGVNENDLYVKDLNLKPIDRFQQDNKIAKTVFTFQNLACIINSLVLCQHIITHRGVTLSQIVRMLNSVTGWNFDLDNLMLMGERIFNLKRMYNIKRGVNRSNDDLPKRILKEPLTEGGAKGRLVNLQAMLDHYYKIRGWTRGGTPTKARLQKLGLNF